MNLTKHPSKIPKMETVEITSTEEEAQKENHPLNDVLVFSLKMANNLVHRILMDNESSTDVLFKSALDKINLEGAK